MTPQELKNSILQQAIQGKLVEQRPEEGTAEELYQQIQAEKQALIKATKIKKDKPLPEITDEEKPFDIPKSWKWCRLTDCGTFITGFTPKPSELSSSGKIPYFKVADMNTSGNELYLLETGSYVIEPKKTFNANTIVYPKNGGAVFTNKKRILAWPSVVDLNTGGYFPLPPINLMYTYYFFQNIDFRQCCKGTALPTIDMDKLRGKIFPLPPLAEQKRIVAKIEELLPLVDRYEAAWTKLEAFNKRFPEDMQKAILQQAIQGKLVEQRPEEGTAEELYQQIQAEKQAMIKAKKIKKDKPLPEITDDEKPFDIPDSWKWVKLATISAKITDGEHKTPHRATSYSGYYLLSARNVRNGFISLDDVDYVDQNEFKQLSKRCSPQYGDVLISCSGSVGRCAVVGNDNNYVMVRSAAMVSPVLLDSNYLMFAVRSGAVQDQIKNRIKQTAQANLFQDAIRNLLIPLPPIAEQKRIVARIEQLLPLCDSLK